MSQVWARVRDKTTGHHFDVTVERLDLLTQRGDAEELPKGQHQRHTGKPCPAKTQRPLGTPAPTPRPKAQAPKAEPKESESA